MTLTQSHQKYWSTLMWIHHPMCRIKSVAIWKSWFATKAYRLELRRKFHLHRMPDVHLMHTDTHCPDQQNQLNYHAVLLDSNSYTIHHCPSHIYRKRSKINHTHSNFQMMTSFDGLPLYLLFNALTEIFFTHRESVVLLPGPIDVISVVWRIRWHFPISI